MATVNPYIYFNGNCEEAFNFYKAVFQKDFTYLGRYKDVPQTDRHVFRETDEKIMHVSLPISRETVLMGSDNNEAYSQLLTYSNFSLIVHAGEKEEADRLFNELSRGGQIKIPLNQAFWGSYYGICIDKFGIMWKVTIEAAH
ncbi:VOC family protein [Terrimonas sp.]|uniref:VOC family protein n=1 Tax=Terrimonas sp. TaxID=1914338 RepID=UPI000D50678F|nr:VOC family protein [Terrimonas sp.]PVD50580.1 VOC family protein [Terrimonas sp.]